MKFIKILILIVILSACGERIHLPKAKFKVGEVVYLKPDSTKVVVVSKYCYQPSMVEYSYYVYKPSWFTSWSYDESQIY